MTLKQLDHVLILAQDLEATKDFYVATLGLRVGDRPKFPFPGYWLYLGDRPCLHLARAQVTEGQRDYLERRAAAGMGGGSIDHVAFCADDLAGTIAHLERLGIPMRRRDVPEQDIHQIFIQDPNGITVELTFPLGEAGNQG